MDIAVILAKFFGIFMLVIGLSALNGKYIAKIIDGLDKDRPLLWLTGLLTTLVGAASVALYDAWSSDWRVLITIIGWLCLIKGIALTVFPDESLALYKKFKIKGLMVFCGIVAILFSVYLLYLGFSA